MALCVCCPTTQLIDTFANEGNQEIMSLNIVSNSSNHLKDAKILENYDGFP